ncbi:MAG: hypothetical protein P8169_11835, partial [Chloroflexota bacterium]
MRQRFFSFVPVLSVILLYAAMTAYAVIRIVQLNDGLFTYGFDDAYIHLTLSRNLALHGAWGLTPDQFSWSISSFTWPLLEAALILIKPSWVLIAPLILNIICSIALLILVDRLLYREGWSWLRRAFAGILLLFLLPLVNQTTMGMEHLLHAVVAIAFFGTFARVFSTDPPSWKDEFLFLLFGMLTVATRFEGGFMIAMSSLMLFLIRRWRLGIMVAIAGLLPIIVGGVIGVAHGWNFLPNSVYLKSITIRFQEKAGLQFLADYRRALFYTFIPFFTLVLANLRIRSLTATDRLPFVSRIIKGLKTPSPRLAELIVFLGMVIAHMIFGRIGQLQRYEV